MFFVFLLKKLYLCGVKIIVNIFYAPNNEWFA